MTTRAELWNTWLDHTLLSDIDSTETPDPVVMIDSSKHEIEPTEEFNQYRYGRGNGQYLYLLYLLEESATNASAVIPVYIGETNKITSRLYQHFKQIRDSLPAESWEGDGSWGSWSKYDHVAAVCGQSESPLYAWILDMDELDQCPYGYSTYRQELEAKLVGLIHSQSRFERVFANREFVPNRVAHAIGKVGPGWLDRRPEDYEPTVLPNTSESLVDEHSKAELWESWVEETILSALRNPAEPDPVPLFDTDERLRVALNDAGGLKRSEAIDRQIRRQGKECVHEDGVRPNGSSGLLYVMYQLGSDAHEGRLSASDVIPRYIGKAEAYGKKNELSANFYNIAHGLEGTRSFARWGDGDFWHVGELSNTVFGRGDKKRVWASELFEQGTRVLKHQVYLWIRAWNPETSRGPYGYPAYLAEAEPLLIGLAHEAYPNQLLNHSGVSDDSPVKTREYSFEPVEE